MIRERWEFSPRQNAGFYTLILQLHSTATGLVPQYGERSNVSDGDNCDPTSGNDEELDELENQAGHAEQSGEQPLKGSKEDNLRKVGLFTSSEHGFFIRLFYSCTLQ